MRIADITSRSGQFVEATGVTTKDQTFYHGTRSEPFDRFEPKSAAKGEQFWNPLGSGMYVTDQEYFAHQFGPNVHEVPVPAGYSYIRVPMSRWRGLGRRIISSAMRMAVKAATGKSLKAWESELYRSNYGLWFRFKQQIDRSTTQNSPYEGLYEIAYVVKADFGEAIGNAFEDALPKISDSIFGKYDMVIFTETNDVVGYVDDRGKHRSALEIVIYNPQLQRAVAAKPRSMWS